MYSVVLMMALSSGVDTPAFCHRSSCSSCSSCSCYSCSSCYGCSSSCHGSRGCSGGGMFSRMFSGHKSCHSCCSYSSCHGCCSYSSCHGSCSYGACHGGYAACSGGCYGGYIGCGGHGCYSCAGYCYGCGGGYAPAGCAMGVPAIQGTPIVPSTPEVKPEVKPEAKPDAPKTGTVASPAKILVNLPADAKLFVDDFATKSTSDNRAFVTPELAPAKAFSYTLKAEIVRDGKTLMASEKVEVKAGEEIRISLPVEKFSAATVAAK